MTRISKPALARLVPPAVLLAAALLAAGCAARPPAGDAEALAEYRETNDPVEPANRVFYRVNDGLDTHVLRPVARGYRAAVPTGVRRPVRNALSNLGNPVQFANDVLQANPGKAGDTLMRFAINSTVGLAGLFDVAAGWGYPDHDADFGLTLAVWGIPEGPFLFLPVLGPSNPRDALGSGVDSVTDPVGFATYGGSKALGWVRFGLGAVDGRERYLDTIDEVKRGALDPYATFRSLYRQNRAEKVEAARADRPATVPAWFPRAVPAP